MYTQSILNYAGSYLFVPRIASSVPAGVTIFFLLALAGWLIYLVIDFGVIKTSIINIDFKSSIILYWKVNFVELIVSFILLFVFSYLYISGSLEEFTKLMGFNVTFSSNTDIKAFFLGFNLKLISALIRKLGNPIKMHVDTNHLEKVMRTRYKKSS